MAGSKEIRGVEPSTDGPEGSAQPWALLDLLSRVESATGDDSFLDASIELELEPGNFYGRPGEDSPAYTASLDAALALVGRCDPGFKWRVAAYTPAEAQACGIDRAERPFWATCGLPGEQEQAAGKTPALALIAALLKALAAGQGVTGTSLDGASPQPHRSESQ